MWRPGPESNRRIEALQASALPLCYLAVIKKVSFNILTKKLYLANKEICLSKFKNIYEELKHLELLVNLNFNN